MTSAGEEAAGTCILGHLQFFSQLKFPDNTYSCLFREILSDVFIPFYLLNLVKVED